MPPAMLRPQHLLEADEKLVEVKIGIPMIGVVSDLHGISEIQEALPVDPL